MLRTDERYRCLPTGGDVHVLFKGARYCGIPRDWERYRLGSPKVRSIADKCRPAEHIGGHVCQVR